MLTDEPPVAPPAAPGARRVRPFWPVRPVPGSLDFRAWLSCCAARCRMPSSSVTCPATRRPPEEQAEHGEDQHDRENAGADSQQDRQEREHQRHTGKDERTSDEHQRKQQQQLEHGSLQEKDTTTPT